MSVFLCKKRADKLPALSFEEVLLLSSHLTTIIFLLDTNEPAVNL